MGINRGVVMCYKRYRVDYLQNSAKQSKSKEYERQIDQMVYKLYDITKEEIAIIEQFVAKNR